MTDQPVQGQPVAAPVVVDDAAELDNNIEAFFNYTMTDDVTEDKGSFTAQPGDTPVAEPKPNPPVEMNPAAAQPSPAQPTPNAEPAASENAGGGEPEVDDGLLAQLMFGEQKPPAAEAPKAEATPAPASPPEGDDNQPFMPLQARRGLIPPQVLDTIFNSEDPVQREDALMGVLTSWGNAILAMADSRVKEHYAPRIQQGFQQAQAIEAARAQAQEDFYGAYPDLKPFPQVVARVANHLNQTRPGSKYDENTKKEIANIARALARKTGLLQSAPAPAATPAPFVAGGARPASHGQVQNGFDPTDPAQMVDQLAW